ncbi:MAG TPA: DUF2087 domain-containing protein [Patescibacteria group bacterium]|nr:DUF2087 domain-containing protein [Patescibacteria group bacterium]
MQVWNLSELFWAATLVEMKQGYLYQGEAQKFVCLICGQQLGRGEVFPYEGKFYDAEKRMELHVQEEHGSVFEYLLQLDKKYTGLTEVQRDLLARFHQGQSDAEIARQSGNSASTVRNHRFLLRERQKQAKVLLAVMELLEERGVKGEKLVDIHRTATMVDERYAVTEAERDKILQAYFKQGTNGPLERFPTKEKRKIVVLRQIMNRFQAQRDYTEKEVNAILKAAHDDYVTLRRYLIEYGFMDRVQDGSRYWVKE